MDNEDVIKTIIQSVAIEKYVESKIRENVSDEVKHAMNDYAVKDMIKKMVREALNDYSVKEEIKKIAQGR